MVERPLIGIGRSVLKCDADGCGYEETIDEIKASYIGMPCPKCGANLLTEDDYNNSLKLLAIAGAINEIFGPVKTDNSNTTGSIISFNPHGDTVTIKVKHNARH